MSPDSKLFARVSIGAKRTSLGHATLDVLFVRASQEIRKIKHREELIIQLEMSPVKLPDSTTFDKSQFIEQQLASSMITDPTAESPFEGISIGRVTEVMSSECYEAFEAICDPVKRIGLTDFEIATIRTAYFTFAPDCALHFPKWID